MKIKELLRKNIIAMQPYSSARSEFTASGDGMVFLDANENPYENGINRYPDTQQKRLKEVLSKLKNVPENQILLGNGSDEVLDLVFRAFCEPLQDNVITLPPTYGMYSVLAQLNAVENREVLLLENFEPDIRQILEKIDAATKIIFVCSPNNPTGNSFSDEDIATLLQSCHGLVLLDEAYIDFSSKESWLRKLNDYPNLVIIQTLSKAYGMAGVRLGVLYASEEIVSELSKIKPPYNINRLTEDKVLEELSEPKFFNDKIFNIKTNKMLLSKQLLEVNFIKKVYVSDANFLLISVDDAKFRYNQLIEKGIVVRNKSSDPLCGNCLRITIGTKEENSLLINTLKSFANG
ncbi:histidinol-phosphate transaminase [Flavobacterium humi]|uniref:Histidinol-phosphate aminotransferase n=1 Tax=Flavobacterium humi TaxID=2562683 RepID=A0A4Z0LCU4_9FLAO|nr:histidinol-phosphate transaminase [Flavobacterium humi]TGD59698.1 histidinol-phosphate transaminase [Flavobacterium humi]